MTRERDMPGGITQWEGLEYQDLVIPLTISVRHWRHPNYVGAAAQQIQPLILASLQEASREGWRADEPTDFAMLGTHQAGPHVLARLIRDDPPYTRQQVGPSGVTW